MKELSFYFYFFLNDWEIASLKTYQPNRLLLSKYFRLDFFCFSYYEHFCDYLKLGFETRFIFIHHSFEISKGFQLEQKLYLSFDYNFFSLLFFLNIVENELTLLVLVFWEVYIFSYVILAVCKMKIITFLKIVSFLYLLIMALN